MSSHDVFDLPTERTEFSDAGNAAFGRSLVFTTRFEATCRALAVLMGIKDRTHAQRNDSTLLDDALLTVVRPSCATYTLSLLP